ncbi:MAG: hypothetical protein HY866_07145 [Chloroflexi bacterium]|nr:hypothetical protein [Chloroflexota bacterium]
MKNCRYLLWIGLIVFVLVLGTGVFATSSPLARAQDDYTYTVVGGVDEPQTYPDQEVDGIRFTALAYRSLYPGGMEFTATITPPEGVTVSGATLFYTFATGKPGRIQAERGENPNEWIARPYEGRGLPPWHEIDVYWSARTGDTLTQSQPVHAVYYDATRQWFRAESEDMLVYWYGMPEDLGRYVLEAMAHNHARYLEGFGEALPYRPMAVIFPPGPDWNEYKGDSSIDDTQLGFTGTIVGEAGSTIQRVRTLEPAEIRKDCLWNPENPTAEFQMQQAASTTTHEVAHLYQQETGVQRGPAWWIEGQAMFFETFEEYPVHERLRTLANLRGGDLPTFQGAGPGGGALTASEDGCTHLIYDLGASFMSWLVDTHGGMDTYRGVVEEIRHGANLVQALETVTGQPFLDLENEWRAFLGVSPVAADVLDPGLTLGAPAEPFFAEGDTVILPSAPFSQPIYTEPKVRSVAMGACFASSKVTIRRAGHDGTVNWYEVDCTGMVGWMNQTQLVAPQ